MGFTGRFDAAGGPGARGGFAFSSGGFGGLGRSGGTSGGRGGGPGRGGDGGDGGDGAIHVRSSFFTNGGITAGVLTTSEP